MQPFWEIVASNALLVVVLAAGVALLGRIWKNPLCLHLLWVFVLLKLVTPPVATVPIVLPARQAPLALEAHAATQRLADQSRVETFQQETASITTVVREHQPSVNDRAVFENPAQDLGNVPPLAERQGLPWLTVLGWIWGVGTVLFASVHAYRILRFRRLFHNSQSPSSAVLSTAERAAKRLGLRRVPEVRVLPVCVSPLVWSLGGRPRVFLPAALFERLDVSAQEAILAHELAHVRRKDHWVRLLEVVITTLFWWHPVVWWAARRLQELEDQCCDAMVVDMAPHGAKSYATALLDTLDFLCDRSIAAPLGATAAKSSVSLTRRIAMLKNRSFTARLTFGRLALLLTVAAVPMALAFAAKPPETKETPSLSPLPLATAQESKEAGRKTESPLKELPVDLGGGVKLEMVLIPAGEFLMGSPDSDKDAFDVEKPQHRVRITEPFYLGRYPVTQEQWEAVMGSNPSSFKGPKNPVEQVSWEDCEGFVKKLNAKTGGGKFSLPTDAQWEYACRAGSTTRYFFGNEESGLGEYAWYHANSGYTTHPVGAKKPNAWGLYDMHGNVWQRCQDWFGGGHYANSLTDDPTGPSSGLQRVNRGGSWSMSAKGCRSAFRDVATPGWRRSDMGFRVARASVEYAKSSEQPTVQRRAVNKLVKDFPEKTDLSTPESAQAAWNRASARMDDQAVLELSWIKWGPRDIEKMQRYRKDNPKDTEIYSEAERNAEILEVAAYRGDFADVISKLTFPEGVGRDPYSSRSFGRINGVWKNLGADRLPSLEAARENFDRKKDGLWQNYVKVRDGIKNGKPIAIGGERPKRFARIAPGEPLGISVEKADLMGRVEWAMMHGARDITARKTIEWGDVEKDADGNRKIRYKFYATIWDKDVYTMNKVFTFDAKGNILDMEDVEGFPQKKVEKPVNVSTPERMKELVEDFFSKNFRDVRSHETVEWGEVTKTENGNSSIRYKYRARIWDKDAMMMNQVFTFDPKGTFVSVKNVDGFPQRQ